MAVDSSTVISTHESRRRWPLDAVALGWLPVAILAAWWVLSENSSSLYFPPLSTIVDVLVRDWLGPHFLQDLLPSTARFVAGFLIAGVGGITLGLVIGVYPRVRGTLEPIIQFFRALPPPVLLPVGLLLFGIGSSMNIAIIAVGAVWPTLLNTIDGVRSLDPELSDMARTYRFTLKQRIMYVLLPNAGPQIFAGLRTTLQISVILIVVAEMYGSTNGVGYYVLNSQQSFKVPETWAGTIVLGVLGYLATVLFLKVERRALRWQHGLADSRRKA